MIERGFGVHGSYVLEREENILIIYAKGPGNLELVQQYHVDVMQMLNEIESLKQWGTLVVLEGTPLIPPDATRLLKQGVVYGKARGMHFAAVVFNGVEFPQTSETFWRGIYDDVGVESAIFQDMAQAKSWISRKLALSHPDLKPTANGDE